MNIHLFQTDIAWEQPKVNFDALAAQIETLQPAPGSLLLFPEMFATGFSMNAASTAEARDATAPMAGFLHDVSAKTQSLVIGGCAVSTGEKFLNEAIAAYPSAEVARYAKHQPFTAGGESEVFEAGDRLLSCGWNGWRIGLSVCYDLRFPEIYRSLALNGAELLVNIANWPRKRIEHWVTLLRARAIENQCYVAGVNRVGEDPHSNYVGRSLVIDPQGKVIADAGETAGIASAEIDLQLLRSWRAEFPALADAREQAPPVAHFQPKEAPLG